MFSIPSHRPIDSCFLVSILGLIPLAHIFEFVGEQMALYCGQTLGDLIVITLSK